MSDEAVKNKIKTLTTYESSDGTKFDKIDDAIRYETRMARVGAIVQNYFRQMYSRVNAHCVENNHDSVWELIVKEPASVDQVRYVRGHLLAAITAATRNVADPAKFDVDIQLIRIWDVK